MKPLTAAPDIFLVNGTCIIDDGPLDFAAHYVRTLQNENDDFLHSLMLGTHQSLRLDWNFPSTSPRVTPRESMDDIIGEWNNETPRHQADVMEAEYNCEFVSPSIHTPNLTERDEENFRSNRFTFRTDNPIEIGDIVRVDMQTGTISNTGRDGVVGVVESVEHVRDENGIHYDVSVTRNSNGQVPEPAYGRQQVKITKFSFQITGTRRPYATVVLDTGEKKIFFGTERRIMSAVKEYDMGNHDRALAILKREEPISRERIAEPLRTIDLFGHVLGYENYSHNRWVDPYTSNKPKKKIHNAKDALKEYGEHPPIGVRSLSSAYKGCNKCAWYSDVFYNKQSGHVVAIENDEDFEIVKDNFVNHMNDEHPDICARKMALRDASKYT